MKTEQKYPLRSDRAHQDFVGNVVDKDKAWGGGGNAE